MYNVLDVSFDTGKIVMGVPNITGKDELLSRRFLVMEQIRLTNRLISGFDVSPDVVNAVAGITNATRSSQEGKKIALAVLSLRISVTDLLPPLFFKRAKELEANIYKPITKNNKPYFKYLSEDPTEQYIGVLEIIDYYSELLNAIFSLRPFRDIDYKRFKKPEVENEFFKE